MESQSISEIFVMPGGIWTSISLDCKRLLNTNQHDIEWEYVPAYGIINESKTMIIFQTREMAYDVEYYTRGGLLAVYPNGPSQMSWSQV